jgi:serine/threonine protein kinase
MAPEILTNCCSDYRKADIWAFGMCLLVMMYQGNPYQTESTITLKKKIING